MATQKVPNSNDIILIINDDVIINNNFLKIGVEKLRSMKNAIISAQQMDVKHDRMVDGGLHFNYKWLRSKKNASPEETNCAPARGLFFRYKDLCEIGNFYPNVLPHYYADTEYTLRASRKGFKIITPSELKVYSDFYFPEDSNTNDVEPFSSLWHGALAKRFFSKGSMVNPIYITRFNFLVSPFPWNFINLLKIWIGFLYQLVRFILGRVYLLRWIKSRVMAKGAVISLQNRGEYK